MTRFIITLLLAFACTSLVASDAQALGALKLGAGVIPNGRVPGGMVALEMGPFSSFIEVFKKSGTTTANLGGNLILKLPMPMLQPYAGAGGGLSKVSGDQFPTKTNLMLDLVVGADLHFSGKVGLFGQIKYIYTFGSGALIVRDVAFQAGFALRLG